MTREQILTLSSTYSAHVARAEATISNRIVGHARLFSRLRRGQGCTIGTADRAANWFSDHWPDDLAWPSDIPRPPYPSHKPSKKEAA